MITKLIGSCFFQAGSLFQKNVDIQPNFRAFYLHSNLETMSPTPTTIEEISNLEIRTNRHSRLFLFRDYAFLTRGIVENEQQSFTVKLLRFNPHPPSLIATLLQESLWRIAKGIAALALTILTLPVWIPILTIAYLNNPLDTSTAIFNGWTRGRELALEEAAII